MLFGTRRLIITELSYYLFGFRNSQSLVSIIFNETEFKETEFFSLGFFLVKQNYPPTDFCAGKNDGKYLIRDVFRYVICKQQRATMQNCTGNTIFDPATFSCESIKFINIPMFCNHRPDSNYANPWSCQRFISCKSSVPTIKPCPLNILCLLYTSPSPRDS